MNSIDSSTTTQSTEDAVVEAGLTELLGDPHVLAAPDAVAHDGAPRLKAITRGGL